MNLISAEGYANAKVHFLEIKKAGEIWVSMKDIGDGLDVKNISDLVLKEIFGVYGNKKLTKEEIKKYKMTEREIFKKFGNLSNDKLNTMSSKFVDVKNNIMTNIIKHCRGEKKGGIRAIDGFRKKLMIANYEISVSMEHVVKSKIGPIFVNEEILEEYSIRIYEIDPYFYEHYKKRYKLVIMIKNTYCLGFIFILLNILYQ